MPFKDTDYIPKKNLVIGALYKGHCRDTQYATWDGTQFYFSKFKFGAVRPEFIKHPEDDEVFDVFFPQYQIKEQI